MAQLGEPRPNVPIVENLQREAAIRTSVLDALGRLAELFRVSVMPL
jgi:hypothetical protein